MEIDYRHRTGMLVLMCLVMLCGLVGVPQRGHAADDEATKIYQLARRLHQENTDLGGFTVWVNGDIGQDLTARRTSLNGGDPLPAFEFALFNSNDTLQSKDMKGPYILNFWASWCSVCRAEFALFSKHIDDKSLRVPVIFVNTLDFLAAAERFMQSADPEGKLSFAIDTDSLLYSNLWLTVAPDTVLVDSEGRIQAIQIGAMSDLSLEFFNEIAEHPGTGSFDRLHPDDQPVATPKVGGTANATSEVRPLASATPG
jgi:thiol-disulfide isomerase/thioredoxin